MYFYSCVAIFITVVPSYHLSTHTANVPVDYLQTLERLGAATTVIVQVPSNILNSAGSHGNVCHRESAA